ncbi:hypothetical protein N9137_02235 [Pseudomonadales bacterium]|nr:hypothetical protein [Pseudomonadales bacterium]
MNKDKYISQIKNAIQAIELEKEDYGIDDTGQLDRLQQIGYRLFGCYECEKDDTHLWLKAELESVLSGYVYEEFLNHKIHKLGELLRNASHRQELGLDATLHDDETLRWIATTRFEDYMGYKYSVYDAVDPDYLFNISGLEYIKISVGNDELFKKTKLLDEYKKAIDDKGDAKELSLYYNLKGNTDRLPKIDSDFVSELDDIAKGNPDDTMLSISYGIKGSELFLKVLRGMVD